MTSLRAGTGKHRKSISVAGQKGSRCSTCNIIHFRWQRPALSGTRFQSDLGQFQVYSVRGVMESVWHFVCCSLRASARILRFVRK